MNKQQKITLAFLFATLVLQFGSLTKLKSIWLLAFTGTDSTSSSSPPVPVNADGSCPSGYHVVHSGIGISHCVKD